MQVAIISDIHSNLEALQVVLHDIEKCQVDRIYCLGDVVSYGADPGECLALIKSSCQVILRGNHEHALCEPDYLSQMSPLAVKAIQWTRHHLSPQAKEILKSWPLMEVGEDARLVHSSPLQPRAFQYLAGRLHIETAFRNFSESICFYGHTHKPAVAEEIGAGTIRMLEPRTLELDPSCRYLINVGSVGQPRNRDSRAQWILVKDQPAQVQFRQVEYDIQLSQKKIRQAGLPSELADRLQQGA